MKKIILGCDRCGKTDAIKKVQFWTVGYRVTAGNVNHFPNFSKEETALWCNECSTAVIDMPKMKPDPAKPDKPQPTVSERLEDVIREIAYEEASAVNAGG